jgi:hypothetical protein
MADRKYVNAQATRSALLAAMFAVLVGACSAEKPPAESRGRVNDQETGQSIAGAIVFGRYMGSIAWGGGACNRVESTVSDKDGWFTLPLDPDAGSIHLEAYHRDYVHGNRTRRAFAEDVSHNIWKVSIQKWDEANRYATTVAVEPTIYHSEKEAMEASGERKDVYLRRFKGTREEKLHDLHTYQIVCGGPPRTTSGLVPVIEAILAEEAELKDSQEGMAATREILDSAKSKVKASGTNPR